MRIQVGEELKHFRAPTLWPRVEFLMQLIGAIGGVYVVSVLLLALSKVAA